MTGSNQAGAAGPVPTRDPRPVEIDKLEEDEALPIRYSITSYGADYPVDGLVKRLEEESIIVPAFQRGYVWNIRRASRFIESLLLGLPVPGIFLSKDPENQKLIVIDGLQRLRTLQYFYKGLFGSREFALRQIATDYAGLTIHTLPPQDRRHLDDTVIHATVVRQDEPNNDQSSIYSVFERLNTESEPLKPQEIRSCIYHGPFNDLLKELNQDPNWRALLGGADRRMRDQELILRFLAMYSGWENYRRPLKGFLNDFMYRNRRFQVISEEETRRVFAGTTHVLAEAIGPDTLRPKGSLNAAVLDAVMVGIARLLDCTMPPPDAILSAFESLLSDEQFASSTARSTADEEQVKLRLALSIQKFGSA